MRDFLAYLRALVRHVTAVVVAIVGSVLFVIPSWIRAALSPASQQWLDSGLTFKVSTIRKAYLIILPLGVFWATFLAWREEHHARQAAEKESPEALRTEVGELRSKVADFTGLFWQPLTDPQRDDLRARLRKLGRHMVHVQHHENTDCTRLAGELGQVFESAGWIRPSPLETGSWNTVGARGITVFGKYPDAEETGHCVMRALVSVLRTGLSFVAGIGEGERTDVVILIGPRQSTQPFSDELIRRIEAQ